MDGLGVLGALAPRPLGGVGARGVSRRKLRVKPAMAYTCAAILPSAPKYWEAPRCPGEGVGRRSGPPPGT